MPKTRRPRISRRKFLGLASGTIAIASLPLASDALAAGQASGSYGGLTANRDFYVTSYGGTPQVDAKAWTLKIDGMVEHPLTLTLADIQRIRPVRQVLTLECIGNPPDGDAIGNAEWTGVMLKPLLERAGVRPGAVYAAMHAADGYSTGVPLAEITRQENWLPYLINGDPLPAEHGYPLRIFIPGKYGMKQPKWITGIEFVDRPYYGYWEQRGWSNEAWRKVNSGFFYPRPSGGIFDILSLDSAAKIKAPTDLVGWALAGPSGIKRVEVSTDDGATWHPAVLTENRSAYVWTVWKYHFAPASPGDFTVRVRATDGNGASQTTHSDESGAGTSVQPQMRLRVVSV